ncbi:MAG: alpha/beta hydrolase [Mycobacteriales bacterium]
MTTFASYDGTVLSYDTVGQGAPLVCLPGGPGRSAACLEDLAGLGAHRTLVLLDPRAVGRSEVPSDPSSLRFDRVAADLEAVRTHLGLDRLDVLAHSAGTIVTQAWAAAHPDRVGALVLVTPSDLLQGGTRADVPGIRASFAAEPWYADAAAAQEALADAPPSQRAALERATRPFFYGRWDERTQEHAASADRQSSKRALLGFGAGLEDLDVAGIVTGLRGVAAPVLVVGGERDGVTGLDSVHAVAGCFPNARVAVVPGAGHFPWVDAPEGFRSAVAGFLGTL